MQTLTRRTPVGWGFWALWVPALAAVGALSYRVGAEVPLANFTLPPAAMIIFGLLAGGVGKRAAGTSIVLAFPSATRSLAANLPALCRKPPGRECQEAERAIEARAWFGSNLPNEVRSKSWSKLTISAPASAAATY